MHRGPLVVALLTGSLALNAIPLWWGADPYKSWAFDEPRPWQILASDGWPARYPVFYRALARSVLRPLERFEIGARVGWSADETHRAYLLLLRAINVLLATATVWIVYRMGRRIGGWRAGWFAGATIALSPTFVYYAKTANLDTPQLFFVAVSALSALRWLDERTFLSACVMTISAALAIATKTPVYALYPLWPIAFVMADRWSPRVAGVPTHPHLARDWRLWGALAIGCSALILLLRLPWAPDELRRQMAAASAALAGRERDWPNTISGHLGLLLDGFDRWGYLFSVPLAVIAAVGLVLMFRRRERRAAAWLIALSMISYYGLFIAFIRFQPVRYYLPLGLLGAVAAGYALARLTTARASTRIATGVLAAGLFAWAGARAVAVDLLMLRDTRLEVEQWLASRSGSAPVLGVGRYQLLPRGIRVWSWDRAQRARCERLATPRDRIVLVSPEDGRDVGARNTLRLLLDGHSGLAPLRTFPRPAWSRRLIPFKQGTNLDKISPAIVALTPSGAPCHDRSWAMRLAGELLARPDPRGKERLTDFLAGYWHSGRRTLLPDRVFATGLDSSGWSYGTAPFAVALVNPSRHPWRPRVELKGYVATEDDPQTIALLRDGRREIRLSGPGWHRLAVPSIPPGERALLVIKSEQSAKPSPGSRKDLGVRVRVLPPNGSPESRG